MQKKHKWKDGTTIKFYFSQEEELKYVDLFIQQAKIWEKYTNLTFEFHRTEKTLKDLRPLIFGENSIFVVFDPTTFKGFSELGNLFNNPSDTTYMNIGVKNHKSLLKGTILHEIGHALGLLHEHQHPNSNVFSNEEELISLCNELQWNERDCNLNLRKAKKDEDMEISPYDRTSLMFYAGLDNLLVNTGYTEVRRSLGLSFMDKLFIAKIYPKEVPLTEEEISEMHKKDIEEEKEEFFESLLGEKCFITIAEEYSPPHSPYCVIKGNEGNCFKSMDEAYSFRYENCEDD